MLVMIQARPRPAHILHLASCSAVMAAAIDMESSSAWLLEEEFHVRWLENAGVALVSFAFFMTIFILAWSTSQRYVPEFRAFTTTLKADWCSRVNSTVHAVVIVLAIVYTLRHTEWSADHMPMSSLRPTSWTFSLSIGYFVFDLLVILWWPIPLQKVFITHHLVAVVPYIINNFISCCASCQFGMLLFLLVEMATIPMNARAFMESLGLEGTMGHQRAIKVTFGVWALVRAVLPVFLIYVFWFDSYPSPRNHDLCLYTNMVSAHVIAAFCVGVFVFMHTPEMLAIRRRQQELSTPKYCTGDSMNSGPSSSKHAGSIMYEPVAIASPEV